MVSPEVIDWRALLDREVAAAGAAGKALVAEKLGVSRTYVSRVMNRDGKSAMAHVPQGFIDRVIERFSVIACPVRHVEVAHAECAKANEPAPTHNPLAVVIWRQCQACPHKPKGGLHG